MPHKKKKNPNSAPVAESKTNPAPNPSQIIIDDMPKTALIVAQGISTDIKLLALLQSRAKNGNIESQFKMGTLYAIDAQIDGQYEAAEALLTKAANNPNDENDYRAKAQYNLALIYLKTGKIAQGQALMRQSANARCPQALYAMGNNIYLSGNVDEALRIFHNAKTNPNCQFAIALINYKKQNFVEAAKFYKLSADANCPEAQRNYADMCRKGEGMEKKNLAEAYKYFTLAASANFQGVQQALAEVKAEWTIEYRENITELETLNNSQSPSKERLEELYNLCKDYLKNIKDMDSESRSKALKILANTREKFKELSPQTAPTSETEDKAENKTENKAETPPITHEFSDSRSQEDYPLDIAPFTRKHEKPEAEPETETTTRRLTIEESLIIFTERKFAQNLPDRENKVNAEFRYRMINYNNKIAPRNTIDNLQYLLEFYQFAITQGHAETRKKAEKIQIILKDFAEFNEAVALAYQAIDNCQRIGEKSLNKIKKALEKFQTHIILQKITKDEEISQKIKDLEKFIADSAKKNPEKNTKKEAEKPQVESPLLNKITYEKTAEYKLFAALVFEEPVIIGAKITELFGIEGIINPQKNRYDIEKLDQKYQELFADSIKFLLFEKFSGNIEKLDLFLQNWSKVLNNKIKEATSGNPNPDQIHEAVKKVILEDEVLNSIRQKLALPKENKKAAAPSAQDFCAKALLFELSGNNDKALAAYNQAQAAIDAEKNDQKTLEEHHLRVSIYNNSLRLYEKKNLEEATEYKQRMGKSVRHSFRKLALYYYNATGKEKDLAQAAKYFQLAADLNDNKAQFSLAVMHYKGENVAQDFKKSEAVFRAAAAGGNSQARKVINNIKEGELEASQEKFKFKIDEVSVRKEKEVKDDSVKPLETPKTQPVKKPKVKKKKEPEVVIRINQESETAKTETVQTPEIRPEELENKHQESPEKEHKEEKESKTQLPEESSYSLYTRGLNCYLGNKQPRDIPQAIQLLDLAAQKNHMGAQFRLGTMYFEGTEIKKDLDKALEYFEAAAKNGHLEARYMAGEVCCEKGDFVNAAKHYAIAAAENPDKQGHREAQYKLAILNYEGKGVTKNLEEAEKFFFLSGKQGKAESQLYLSLMYYGGINVGQNFTTARFIIEFSREQGMAVDQAKIDVLERVILEGEHEIEQAKKINQPFDLHPSVQSLNSLISQREKIDKSNLDKIDGIYNKALIAVYDKVINDLYMECNQYYYSVGNKNYYRYQSLADEKGITFKSVERRLDIDAEKPSVVLALRSSSQLAQKALEDKTLSQH